MNTLQSQVRPNTYQTFGVKRADGGSARGGVAIRETNGESSQPTRPGVGRSDQ